MRVQHLGFTISGSGLGLSYGVRGLDEDLI